MTTSSPTKKTNSLLWLWRKSWKQLQVRRMNLRRLRPFACLNHQYNSIHPFQPHYSYNHVSKMPSSQTPLSPPSNTDLPTLLAQATQAHALKDYPHAANLYSRATTPKPNSAGRGTQNTPLSAIRHRPPRPPSTSNTSLCAQRLSASRKPLLACHDLQAEQRGERDPENADLLCACGRCLYHVAVGQMRRGWGFLEAQIW